jgi:hypothetical protein
VAAPTIVAKYTPVLESRDGVLDACSSPAMSPPALVAEDATSSKHRCYELGHRTVAIGEHSPVMLT